MARPKRWLLVANWKMNVSLARGLFLMRQFRRLARKRVELVVAPPVPLLFPLAKLIGRRRALALASQTVAWQDSGALTGEVSPKLLTEIGCRYALIGHSERKRFFGETVAQSARRLGAALAAGLVPVVCVGEDWADRVAGRADTVVEQQITTLLTSLPRTLAQPLVFCYEPFWTISTSGGRIATSAEVAHGVAVIWQALRNNLPPAAVTYCRVLYGGTVSAETMQSFTAVPGLSGFLVGSAALEVATLQPMLQHLNHQPLV